MSLGGTPRLRVALVEFSPSGGLFQFAAQLGEGLARCGHEVALLTGPDPELSSREPGLEIRTVLPTWHPGAPGTESALTRKSRRVWRAVLHLAAWLTLLRCLRRMQPDVVLWSTWRFPTDGWFVRLVDALLPEARLGIVAHEPRPLVEQSGADPIYKDHALLTSALEGAYRCMDVVFALGDEARAALVEAWRPVAPVVVIPHGDESVFLAEDVPPVETTGPEILFFGTWTRYKGIDVLLEAFGQVREEMPEARLVLAGAVSGDMDLGHVEQRAAEVGGVTLRPGYVPLGDVAGHFGSARVVVLPYTRASQSGVAHLAMTFSRPVVASRVGDIPDAVPDGIAGWTVEPDAPADLAVALLAALRDPAVAAERGRAGAALVRTDRSWDTVARKVSAALQRSLSYTGG